MKKGAEDPAHFRILIAKIYLIHPSGLLRVILQVTVDVPFDIFLRLENSEMAFTEYISIQGEEFLHRLLPLPYVRSEDVQERPMYVLAE